MNLNSRIAVFGWSGFVGKNLIPLLEKTGYTKIIKPRVDLTNLVAVEEFFRESEPEYVINLSGKVGGIEANRKDNYGFLFKNVLMQSNVIEYSIKYRVKKVLNLGSSCIYPKDFTQPLKEEYLLQGPLEKSNEGYSLAKIVGLKLAEYANKQFEHTKFISLMPSNLYGPHDHFDIEKGHALAALIVKVQKAFWSIGAEDFNVVVWGSGKQFREWLFVEDLCDCIIWSMNNLSHTDTFLNVGTGIDISMNDLVHKIKEVYCGKTVSKLNIINDTSKPDGMMYKRMDITNINGLGWKAKTDLETGLEKTIDWYRRVYSVVMK